MHTIRASTKISEYDVYIGNNIISRLAGLFDSLSADRFVVVTDQQIANQYLSSVTQYLPKDGFDVVILDSGEQNKNLPTVIKIIDVLLQKHHDRSSTLISLGGGVVGDVTGFAASIFMRGIKWIQIPTTLLAQVDASIGGKTGCNYAGVKNLLGTFYQPNAVIIDTYFLNSLSKREYNAALAEVIKYGVACDHGFFRWLEKNIVALRDRDPSVLLEAIDRCCRIKLHIVELDENDHGARMALNFGHTFAHALESATDFKHYLHGEAVALGMLLATELAVKLELVQTSLLMQLNTLLSYLTLPLQLELEKHSVEQLCNFMLHDKKNRGAGINLILPCALGTVRVVKMNGIDCIEEIFKDYVSP